MMFKAPKKIFIPSDENVLELIREIKEKGEISYEYKYIISETKTGSTIVFDEKTIKDYLSKGIFKEIK